VGQVGNLRPIGNRPACDETNAARGRLAQPAPRAHRFV